MSGREREERDAARRADEFRPHPTNCLCRGCAEDNARGERP